MEVPWFERGEGESKFLMRDVYQGLHRHVLTDITPT